MKILLLTPHLPEPARQGTALRNGAFLRLLGARHAVDLLTFLAPGEVLGADNPLHDWCGRIAALPQPERSTATRVRDTLLARRPDMALRLASPAMAAILARWIADTEYDIIQVEGIEMAPYGLQVAAARGRSRLLFDDHNCEFLLQKRNAQTDLRHPRRWPAAFYSLLQWAKLRAYEAQICRSADAVLAVSEPDAAALRALEPACSPVVITNGVDLAYNTPGPQRPSEPNLQAETRTLVFAGKMDYRPNVDAVLWFADEVLPLLAANEPTLRLQVVGRNPHPRLDVLRGHTQIEITGGVADVRPYLWNADVVVIPLRVGGGTRFKALEAMACAVPIVSTRLGVEGIGVRQGVELLPADSPAAFAEAIRVLLSAQNAALRAHLAANGRRFVEEHYGWEPIVERLETLYTSMR